MQHDQISISIWMERSGALSHLEHNEARQKNQEKVVENHRPFQVEGFAVGHYSRACVQYEEEIAQQDHRHVDRTLHQWVAPQPWV